MRSMSNEVINQIIRQTIKNGGATYDVFRMQFVEVDDYWYFPKHPSKTKIVNIDVLEEEIRNFIKDNASFWKEDLVFLGTWVNPNSKKCYLDITTKVVDKDTAKAMSRQVSEKEGRKIVTIYNPKLSRAEYVWDDIRI